MSLEGYENRDDFQNSTLPNVIKEGIGCDVCHFVTKNSKTVETEDNVAANSEYHLYPGENIKFGSISDPVFTNNHNSEYNPIYSQSENCLPCHNFVIRGVEAEVTFSEWARIPGLAMSGTMPCQSCHMPAYTGKAAITGPERIVHRHNFIGVDLDLTAPAEQSSQYEEISQLLQSAAEMEFKTGIFELSDEIYLSNSDSLEIPLTVTSKTAHNVPSGVPFAREVWVELKVMDETGNILYSSGLIYSPQEELNTQDENLVLFNTILYDENDNFTLGVTDAHRVEDYTLPALGFRYHTFKFSNSILAYQMNKELTIQARLLFRIFKPEILAGHQNLLNNLNIFEMGSISNTITVLP